MMHGDLYEHEEYGQAEFIELRGGRVKLLFVGNDKITVTMPIDAFNECWRKVE